VRPLGHFLFRAKDYEIKMTNRILIALQYWEGDRERALALARFLADLEVGKSQLADFLFVCRFDSAIDTPTVNHVARKFNVYTFKSRRRETGWPNGCNGLWFSTMEWVQSMIAARKVPAYKAIFTCESDGCPIQRNWLEYMSLEWDRVNKPKPVVIAGALVEPGPHINGNALITGEATFLHWIARLVSGVRPNYGWDYFLAQDFKRLGWANLPGIRSLYNTPTFSSEQYKKMIDDDLFWVHGGKDTSLITFGRERFKV
jgi:hypothetical protein